MCVLALYCLLDDNDNGDDIDSESEKKDKEMELSGCSISPQTIFSQQFQEFGSIQVCRIIRYDFVYKSIDQLTNPSVNQSVCLHCIEWNRIQYLEIKRIRRERKKRRTRRRKGIKCDKFFYLSFILSLIGIWDPEDKNNIKSVGYNIKNFANFFSKRKSQTNKSNKKKTLSLPWTLYLLLSFCIGSQATRVFFFFG